MLKRSTLFNGLCIIFTGLGVLFTQIVAGQAASGSKDYPYQTVQGDPLKARIYELDNGLKVYLSVNKKEPRIMTRIVVRAGSKNDPADATGLAHYLEHMMFKGNSRFGTVNWEKEKKILQQISDLYEKRRETVDAGLREAIYAEIDSLSQLSAQYAVSNEYDKMVSSIGAKYTNAYTSDEQTVYINNIPANELEKWLKLESARFEGLVLRLFHTELETVFEEFNRSQDNDYRKISFTMDSQLFQTHPYGTQTTIGKGEHLKNPSMEKINAYFDTYYVPNNMAICLSGDLDPAKTIQLIDKYFGDFSPKEDLEFSYEPEAPITEPREAEVYGPMSESVAIGFRFNGYHSRDRVFLSLIGDILYNRNAGLIDLDLVQDQKVLSASAYARSKHDYSELILRGKPREGQSLKEVRDLLLNEVEKIKNGEFEDWLVEAVLRNNKLTAMRRYDNDFYRTSLMSGAFVMNAGWKEIVNRFEELEKVTREELIQFAKQNFQDNYAVVYKRNGEDKNIYKVPKPQITPVKINRDTHSVFYKAFENMPSKRLKPEFLDFEKSIYQDKVRNVPYYYVKNKVNDLFSLYYILDMGTNSDPAISLAVEYLSYLGTSRYTAGELKKEFFRMGVDYGVYAGDDKVYVYLTGLESSLEKGLKLFEHFLEDAQPDAGALRELKKDVKKERENHKKNKWRILYSALYNYGKYGSENPFTNVLPPEELQNIKAEKLTRIIHSINDYEHRIFYYGKSQPENVKGTIAQIHKTPEKLKAYPKAEKFTELVTDRNQVYYVDYDMVQTEMMLISRDVTFDKELLPYAKVFNQYFGSGLSSIVFQEIRESRALAYSAWAAYVGPDKKDRSHYVRAYIGTQADKLPQATGAMLNLMKEMPEASRQFQDCKLSALKNIETDRITGTGIFWRYESMKELGLDYDIRKGQYSKIKEMELDDLKQFFNNHIKGKQFTYLLMGKKENIDKEDLEVLGDYEEVNMKELFGY